MTSPLRSVQCVANSRRSGEQCKSRAILGGTVCRMHGGSTERVKRKAAERVLLAQAAAEADVADPMEVLARACHFADVQMQHLADRIKAGAIEIGDVEGMSKAIDRAARIAKTVLDSGIDERRVRIAEAQGRVLFDAVRGALDDFGMAGDAAGQLLRCVAVRLRELEADHG